MRWKQKPRTDEWERWFAWHPVIPDDPQDVLLVWLEHIERRRSNKDFELWEYRLIQNKPKGKNMKTYTVIGIWKHDYKRFAAWYEAENPQQAERMAEDEYSPNDSPGLIIAGVVEGNVDVVA